MDALGAAGADPLTAHILGSGATATSVLVALARLGASSVTVSARSPQKARHLGSLAGQLGLDLVVVPFGTPPVAAPTLVVSTVPGGADLDFPVPAGLSPDAVLLDVTYDPWPTALATRWSEAGGAVLSGLEMLMWQALRQVRVFVFGDQDTTLDNERLVIDAMRRSVGLAITHE
jgi:shikimate dehydrogenase